MTEQEPPGDIVPSDVYCLFAGFIDQPAVQRFHNLLSIGTQKQIKAAHLLFQSSGGNVGDGISLYNLFRASPIEINIYNVGSISSIGVIAYLGAAKRKVSAFGSFMIHRAYLNQVAATSDRMAAATDQLLMEDQRIEAILKSHANISAQKWEQHKYTEVWLSASEAVTAGLAQEIGEFCPPANSILLNVWPPQQ